MSSSKVFIPDDSFVWLTGEVVNETNADGIIEVRVNDEAVAEKNEHRSINLKKLGYKSLPLQNLDLPREGVDDMCTLNYLHEASILDNLRRRFQSHIPYTYTGDICVAVNPYQWLDIYTIEMRSMYIREARHDIAPHVYATSAAAYADLTKTNRNQSILVSGESGAGKTETVKILMGHFAFIASREGDKVIDKLLKANPLLESFGNAKTARNDNSSRFGKFSLLEFNKEDQLVGSKCITYLLEKSRVVGQSSLERNYHVLYQILASPEDRKQKMHLSGKSVRDFTYTRKGDVKTHIIEGVEDSDRYKSTIAALELLGVVGELRELVERALAGLLYLGNVVFKSEAGNEEVAVIDKDSSEQKGCSVACSELLGVDLDEFESTTVTRTIEVEGQSLNVPLTVEQADSGRDALAKEVYARLFRWLVNVINFNTAYGLNFDETDGLTDHQSKTISLLDIFGFEHFQVNRFEQLCINYANEALQQKFTQDIFKTVQMEYEEEGLRWEHITYQDNAHVLDLIEGKRGIIAVLNEECLIPRGSDSGFLSKARSKFTEHASFSFNPTSRDEFSIQHYAGKVTYCTSGFLDRNKDTLPEDMRKLIASSQNALLSRIFTVGEVFGGNPVDVEKLYGGDKAVISTSLLLTPPTAHTDSVFAKYKGVDPSTEGDFSPREDPPATSGRGMRGGARDFNKRASYIKADTVTTKFKTQLSTLMEMISLTQVQYVRCIKPNALKSSSEFNRLMAVEQLRCAGMIEAIRISRAAYPNRLLYRDFMSRFVCLCTNQWQRDLKKKQKAEGIISEDEQLKDACRALLLEYGIEGNAANQDNIEFYQLGNTKVYFSGGVLERLETLRSKMVISCVVKMQKTGRGYVVRHRFVRMRAACVSIQSGIRRYRGRRAFLKAYAAIILLQSRSRIMLARRLLVRMRIHRATSILQATRRMLKHRRPYRRMKKHVVVLQALARMMHRKSRYIEMRDAARAHADLLTRLEKYETQIAEEQKMREEKEAALAEAAREREEQMIKEAEARAAAEKELAEMKSAMESLEEEKLSTLELRVKELESENDSLKSQMQSEADDYREKISQQNDQIERLSELLAEAEAKAATPAATEDAMFNTSGGPAVDSEAAEALKEELKEAQELLDAAGAENGRLQQQLQAQLEKVQEECVKRSEVEMKLMALKDQVPQQGGLYSPSENVPPGDPQLSTNGEGESSLDSMVAKLKHAQSKNSELTAEVSRLQAEMKNLTQNKPHSGSFSSMRTSKVGGDPSPAELEVQRIMQDLMNGMKLESLIFLASKCGKEIVEKPAMIRKKMRKDTSTQSASITGDEMFEIELAGGGEQVKRLKFCAGDLKLVRKGRGKTISIKKEDAVCMSVNIEGKGELNMHLNSEVERDAVVYFFRAHMSSKSKYSIPSKTGPTNETK